MISRYFTRGFRTGKIGGGLDRSGRSLWAHRSLEHPSMASKQSSAHSAGGTRTRVLFGFLALACIPVMIVASAKQLRRAGDLEKRLVADKVCQVAGQVDALVAVRSAAVKMSAGSLELENLNSSAELNKILTNLKELFPDFLSIEICNERGQTIAMMGDLSLAQVGRKGNPQEAAKAAIPVVGPRMQFRDEPSDQSFFITLPHRGTDGAVWFSRSRFSRDALEHILGSSSADHALLVPISESEGRAATEVSGARSTLAHRDYAVATDGSWFPRTITATAPLATPGWVVRRTAATGGSAFSSLASLGAACVALFCALLALRSARQRGEESYAPQSPNTLDVPGASVPVPAVNLQEDKDAPVPPLVRDRLNEPLVPVLPLPDSEPPAYREDDFFTHSDAQAPVTDSERTGTEEEPEPPCDPSEYFCFGHKVAEAPAEGHIPHSGEFEPEFPSGHQEEADFGARERYWPAAEIQEPERAETLQAALHAEEELPIDEVAMEQPAEKSADFDALLPACAADYWVSEFPKPANQLPNASFDSAEADKLPPTELPYEPDYCAEGLPETEFCYDAEIPHATESDFAAWDAEFPKEWDESAVGPLITAQPAEALPADTVVEAKLESAPTEPDNSIPDSLEITWFEPASESEEGPTEKEAAPSTEKVSTVRFVSI
jgi:hypothetical protein